MTVTSKLRGWLLDLYPDEAGLSVWMLGQDGKRHHLLQEPAEKEPGVRESKGDEHEQIDRR